MHPTNIKLRDFAYRNFALRNIADAAVLAKIYERNTFSQRPRVSELHALLPHDGRTVNGIRALLTKFAFEGLIEHPPLSGVWTIHLTPDTKHALTSFALSS